MAADSSFDIVSKVDLQEVKNAIDQATKEVNARFDLKNSKSTIELEGTETVQLASQDEYTLKAVISSEPAKKIVAFIKESKLKAQASIQGDTVRVVSKDRDTLQQIIALLRGKDLGIDLQFTNYR
jgi:uncharacterized protein YajQ (UPF0234 family)